MPKQEILAKEEETLSVVTQAAETLAMIERAANNPNVDVSKMRELLAMRKELLTDEAEREFNKAMNEAQKEIQPVAHNADNPHTKSTFANEEAIDAAVRPIYIKHGFSISFDSEEGDRLIRVTAHVAHTGGFTKQYHLSGAPDSSGPKGGGNKTEVQGSLSTVSYLKRGLVRMIFNVVTKKADKDGNAEYIDTELAAEFDNRLVALGEKYRGIFLAWAKIENTTQIAVNRYDYLNRELTKREAEAQKKQGVK